MEHRRFPDSIAGVVVIRPKESKSPILLAFIYEANPEQ